MPTVKSVYERMRAVVELNGNTSLNSRVAGGLLELALIAPGRSRVEELGRDARAGLRVAQLEDRIVIVLNLVGGAGWCGVAWDVCQTGAGCCPTLASSPEWMASTMARVYFKGHRFPLAPPT